MALKPSARCLNSGTPRSGTQGVARNPPRIVSVGILEPRKNQGVLLDAFEALRTEGIEAELHLVDAPPRNSAIQPAGNHFCVAVEDLDAAVAELDREGVDYVRGAQGEVMQIWIADPAGNTIELQQDRSLA